MPLSLLCRRPPRWLFGLLILSLLAPGLVPVQAHTRLAKSASGQLYELCTWQGEDQQPHTPEPWQSPAYAYAMLFGGATAGLYSPLVATPLFFTLSQPLAAADACAQQACIHQPIRAPPGSSVLPIPC